MRVNARRRLIAMVSLLGVTAAWCLWPRDHSFDVDLARQLAVSSPHAKSSAGLPPEAGMEVGQVAERRPDAPFSRGGGRLRGVRVERPEAGKLRPSEPLAHLLDALRGGMDRVEFDQLFARWLGGLNAQDTLRAMAILRGGNWGEDTVGDVQARLVRHLCEVDVNAAQGEINTMPTGEARTLAVEELAVVWANRQLADATAWARQLPAGDERDQALFAVAGEAARAQPAEALRLADELPPNHERDELVTRAVSEWAVNDPAAATTWAQGIADDDLRTQTLAGVVTAWSAHDPAAAGVFALQELPAGRLRDDAVIGVAQRWARRSPEAAASWAVSLPASELRSMVVTSVAAAWKQNDAAAAQQWLVGLSSL